MSPVTAAWDLLSVESEACLMTLLCDRSRIYHGLHHINQLLIDADRCCDSDWQLLLRLAILYHDAVYDPLAKDNEEQSAQMWLKEFPFVEMDNPPRGWWLTDVATAIRASANHFVRADDLLPWQHAFLDLDLGGLGAHPRLYRANGLLIEHEYKQAGVTDDQFLRGRIGFLGKALATDRLYYVVHQDREQQARENMQTELDELSRTLTD